MQRGRGREERGNVRVGGWTAVTGTDGREEQGQERAGRQAGRPEKEGGPWPASERRAATQTGGRPWPATTPVTKTPVGHLPGRHRAPRRSPDQREANKWTGYERAAAARSREGRGRRERARWAGGRRQRRGQAGQGTSHARTDGTGGQPIAGERTVERPRHSPKRQLAVYQTSTKHQGTELWSQRTTDGQARRQPIGRDLAGQGATASELQPSKKGS